MREKLNENRIKKIKELTSVGQFSHFNLFSIFFRVLLRVVWMRVTFQVKIEKCMMIVVAIWVQRFNYCLWVRPYRRSIAICAKTFERFVDNNNIRQKHSHKGLNDIKWILIIIALSVLISICVDCRPNKKEKTNEIHKSKSKQNAKLKFHIIAHGN